MFNVLLAFVLGSAAGSFLNVCIYRIPRGISIVRPRSFCPKCGTPIKPWDNLPILGWIFLRGRCRHCKKPISPRYPLLEFTNALLFATMYLRFGLSLTAVRYTLLGMALLVAIFIDLDHQIIPDVVTLPAVGLGILSAFPMGWNAGVQALLGAAIGGAAVLVIALFGKALFGQESMGGGDLKLAAAIGAFTGWAPVLGVLLLSFFLALPAVALGMLCRKITLASRIPFGPFIAIAAYVVMFWGPQLWNLYISMGQV